MFENIQREEGEKARNFPKGPERTIKRECLRVLERAGRLGYEFSR
jgi:hypothetical protein